MTKKPFFLKAIVLLLFFSFPAAAQETLPSDKTTVETQSDDVPAETAETTDGQSAAVGDSEKTAPAAAASSSAAGASQNAAQSREPDYEEIFRWGMDDQILSTLKTLTEEKKTVPAELIDRLYAETLSESVKAACLDYWRETRNALHYDVVLDKWSELPQRTTALQSASLKYLFAFLPEKEDEKTVGVLSDVLRYADFKVQTELMDLIAEKGMTVFEPVLTELGQTSEDRPALQAAVLKTLGKLKTPDAFETLKARLADPDASTDIRMAAAEGLGGYGTPEAFTALEPFMSESNIYLRLRVFQALLSTDNPNLSHIIEQGGKDAYWQIRRDVFRFIGDHNLTEYAPMLLFKAKNEPERTVRDTVLRELGKMKTAEARSYLQETVRNDKNSMPTRKIAFDALAGFQYASQIPFLMDLWSRYKEKPSGTIAEHMAMRLSVTKESGLDVMYELFFLSPVGLFKVYAIRGIALNGSSSCRAEIEKLQQSDRNDLLAREARKIDYGASTTETPSAETPSAETSAAETSAAETSAAETSAAETPTTETPTTETPTTETPTTETPTTETPSAEVL